MLNSRIYQVKIIIATKHKITNKGDILWNIVSIVDKKIVHLLISANHVERRWALTIIQNKKRKNSLKKKVVKKVLYSILAFLVIILAGAGYIFKDTLFYSKDTFMKEYNSALW